MRNSLSKAAWGILLVGSIFLSGCKSGPFNFVKPASPHQQYERQIVSAGLDKTAMGGKWISNANRSLEQALLIKLPYQEIGYFSAEKAEAIAYRFKVSKGERVQLKLAKKPTNGFKIYMDLWEPGEGNFKFIAAADTLTDAIQIDADRSGEYILRLQPELLAGGQFTINASSGPSLAYPLKAINRNQIQSIFGDGRDENTRKHEGIDIFAPFRTPVLAAAQGTITGVNTNNLGGKVVWLRPEGKNFTLYYAHLDEQLVVDGQSVAIGDTLGLIGNTGNAKTTPPHLHFGIYTSDGAVDPLPFINPVNAQPSKIISEINKLNMNARTTQKTTIAGQDFLSGTVVRLTGAAANHYRVELPDGKIGFVAAKSISTNAVSKLKVKSTLPVYDHPNAFASVKENIQTGEALQVLGNFGGYKLLIRDNEQLGWILE